MAFTEEQKNRLDSDIMKAHAILNCMMMVVSSGKELDTLPLTDAALDYLNDAGRVMEDMEKSA